MKIGVLFNCQHTGLSRALRALRPDDDIISFGFPALANSAKVREIAKVGLSRCDVVIAAPGPARVPPAEMRDLKKSISWTVPLPTILFAGYHPDTCYISSGGRPLIGPTEALHSRIAIAGFLAGLSVTDTASLYNRLIFARLGYIDQFPAHCALITERFAAHGVDLVPSLAHWRKIGCFMHSPNHPKGVVLFDLARIVCSLLGVTANPDAVMPPDDLADTASHPVYADLAASIGAKAEKQFRPASVKGIAPAALYQAALGLTHWGIPNAADL